MGYVRKTIENMSGYTPGEQINRRVVKLNTNENPYPPAPGVLKTLQEHADESLRRYPNPTSQELREKASEIYDFPVEGILAGNGSDDLLTILFRSMLDPGDKVTTFIPTYTLYETLALLQDAELKCIERTDSFEIPGEFKGDSERFVIIANPNSPTGTLTPKKRVREIAENIDGVLVVDEAYGDFASEDCIDLARELPNVVVLRSFSKSYALAGMRLGLSFASAELTGQFMKVKDSYNVNRLTALAGTAALSDQAWLKETTAKIIRTRETLEAGLKNAGLEPVPSQSNFVFVQCPEGNAEKLYLELKAQNILVRYFNTPRTDQYLRISVGTDEENETLLSTLGNVLNP